MKYRAKPEEFDAFRYYHDPCPEWFTDAQGEGVIVPGPEHCVIRAAEGELRADKGDYIIRDGDGQMYPMSADLFEEIYEPATPCT